MYAIKVELQAEGDAAVDGRRPFAEAGDLIRDDPQPGVAHVSFVAVPPYVVAMTFVMATDLLAAERIAASAWETWLTRAWGRSWQVISCTADLLLGVWAVNEPPAPETDW